MIERARAKQLSTSGGCAYKGKYIALLRDLHIYESVLYDEVAFEKRIQDGYVYIVKLEIVCVIETEENKREFKL